MEKDWIWMSVPALAGPNRKKYCYGERGVLVLQHIMHLFTSFAMESWSRLSVSYLCACNYDKSIFIVVDCSCSYLNFQRIKKMILLFSHLLLLLLLLLIVRSRICMQHGFSNTWMRETFRDRACTRHVFHASIDFRFLIERPWVWWVLWDLFSKNSVKWLLKMDVLSFFRAFERFYASKKWGRKTSANSLNV